ncbi:MAG: hypothetical protein ABIP53_09020 [Candidatus Limnocylindrales bacterium]
MTQQNREPATENRPATPRWVKALALAAVVIIAVVIVVMLVAGGEHGPGRHGGRVDSVALTSPSRAA